MLCVQSCLSTAALLNGRIYLCDEATMSQQRSGFMCCERKQRKNRRYNLGSKQTSDAAQHLPVLASSGRRERPFADLRTLIATLWAQPG